MAKSERAIAVSETEEPDGPAQFTVGGLRVCRNGLLQAGLSEVTYDDWETLGHRLSVMERGLQFVVGDWINFGEERFDEMASQAVDAASWSPQTVKVYRWVAAQVPYQNRRMDKGLGFRHHMLVATLNARDQRRWLDKAVGDEETGPWSVKRLRDAINEGLDLPEIAWWAVVSCKSAADLSKFIKKTELEGRTCKASVRRGRKKAEV